MPVLDASAPPFADHVDVEAFGYRVHFGGANEGELAGRWWWTLFQAGWSGVECAPDHFETEAEAWEDAGRAYRLECAEVGDPG